MNARFTIILLTSLILSACSKSQQDIATEALESEPPISTETIEQDSLSNTLINEVELNSNIPQFKVPPGAQLLTYFYDFVTLQAFDDESEEAKAITELDDLSDYFIDETHFEFTQIRGLTNKLHERRINALLKPDLQYFNAANPSLISSSVDSTNVKSFSDAVKSNPVVTVHRKINEKLMPDRISEDYYTASLDYLYKHYASLTFYEYYDGNMAAHPNFGSRSLVIDLDSEKAVTLGDLMQGNYMSAIKKLMKEIEIDGLPEEDFCDEGSIQHKWAERTSSSTEVAFLSEDYLILRADTREFGCAQVARGIMEAVIPLKNLHKYLR